MRIRGAVPAALVDRLDDAPIYAPRFGRASGPLRFEIVFVGVMESHRLKIVYAGEIGAGSSRIIRQLGLYFWGKVWTLAAWCELREDFRSFRLDRMRDPQLGRPFVSEPD